MTAENILEIKARPDGALIIALLHIILDNFDDETVIFNYPKSRITQWSNETVDYFRDLGWKISYKSSDTIKVKITITL